MSSLEHSIKAPSERASPPFRKMTNRSASLRQCATSPAPTKEIDVATYTLDDLGYTTLDLPVVERVPVAGYPQHGLEQKAGDRSDDLENFLVTWGPNLLRRV